MVLFLSSNIILEVHESNILVICYFHVLEYKMKIMTHYVTILSPILDPVSGKGSQSRIQEKQVIKSGIISFV